MTLPDVLGVGFRLANGLATLAWIVLVAGPRRTAWRGWIGSGVVLLLCVAYTVLIQVFFFGSPGGFFSLPAVQRLFDDPAVALAGWLHYLAIDLLAGLAIARQADAMRLSRWLQAPILGTTFMFGPVGWLAFFVVAQFGWTARRSAPAGGGEGRA